MHTAHTIYRNEPEQINDISERRDTFTLQKVAGYEASFDMEVINGKTVFTGGTQYQMSLDYQKMLNFT